MEYEDRLTIPTPEGVDLELTLAGVGSRFASALLDYVIQLVIIVALGLVLGLGIGLSPGANGFAAAVWIVLSFLLFVGYDITFEVLAAGRTPGKRANGLRVVREDGGPVSFPISAARNVLRIVDILPGMYLVGILAILISGRNQRLGDLAAGTLVVRERRALPPEPVRVYRAGEPRAAAAAPAWDTSAIDDVELAAVRSFLARRYGLTDDARAHLARELAARLQPKVGGGVDADSPELFLERLVAAKLGRP
jgi:uncharacterized RDD family membrane protein YckC